MIRWLVLLVIVVSSQSVSGQPVTSPARGVPASPAVDAQNAGGDKQRGTDAPSPEVTNTAAMRRASLERACRALKLDPDKVFNSPAPGNGNGGVGAGVAGPDVDQLSEEQKREFRRERLRKVARKLIAVAEGPELLTLVAPSSPVQKAAAGIRILDKILKKETESASFNDPDSDEIREGRELLKDPGNYQDLADAIEIERKVSERQKQLENLKAKQQKTLELEEVRIEEYRIQLHREQLEKELGAMP